MQLRSEQLAAHLTQGVKPLYVLCGDEPLQMQEAGDALRAAARTAGFDERKVFTVSGAHFDWAGLIGAAQAQSLFSERQLIELRIPTGKPGKDGSDALQRLCELGGAEVMIVIYLPRLDRQQQQSSWFTTLERAGVVLRFDTVERRDLPAWLARRLAAQGQRVDDGEAGPRTLAFFADRVEGNLLAAHQELQKLALLYPGGVLTFEQIEAAVLNVARYDVFRLGEAVLAAQVTRALRMLEGLQAEGEAAVLVHWTLSEDLRALKRVRDAVDAGRPLPMALREARVWGAKERLFERAVPRLGQDTLAALLDAAQVCDGIVKGLGHPHWPADPWQALRRLTLQCMQAFGGAASQPHTRLALRA